MPDDGAEWQLACGIGSRVDYCPPGPCGETGAATCAGHDVWRGYE